MTTHNNNRVFKYIAGVAFVFAALLCIISIFIFIFQAVQAGFFDANRFVLKIISANIADCIGFVLIAVSCFISKPKIMTVGSLVLVVEYILYHTINFIGSVETTLSNGMIALLLLGFRIMLVLYSTVDKHAMKFAFAAVALLIVGNLVSAFSFWGDYYHSLVERILCMFAPEIVREIPTIIGIIMLALYKMPFKSKRTYPVQTATVNGNNDINAAIEDLEKLSHLLDIGAITREEYEIKKAQILDKR